MLSATIVQIMTFSHESNPFLNCMKITSSDPPLKDKTMTTIDGRGIKIHCRAYALHTLNIEEKAQRLSLSTAEIGHSGQRNKAVTMA
jgi:hypothetical protein